MITKRLDVLFKDGQCSILPGERSIKDVHVEYLPSPDVDRVPPAIGITRRERRAIARKGKRGRREASRCPPWTIPIPIPIPIPNRATEELIIFKPVSMVFQMAIGQTHFDVHVLCFAEKQLTEEETKQVVQFLKPRVHDMALAEYKMNPKKYHHRKVIKSNGKAFICGF